MSKFHYLAASGAAVVLATTLSTVALAWHPQGKITKEVQNVTSNSAYADANDATTAIAAKPGDTLQYRITVVNPAPAADNQYNDLTKIKVTDTLPTGVALASGVKDKDFGSIVVVPQSTKSNGTKSVSYTFTVKVAGSVADKTVICNTATYNGNSVTGDAPRTGEDKACVKVTVPPAPKQIQVCDLTTKAIVTINEDQFDAKKHSKNLDDCKVVAPKQIQVCELATKKVITIDENKFDASKHSKNVDDCKTTPAPVKIQVCELATKKVVEISESAFDAQKYSKDLSLCIETPVTTPTTPQVLPAELPSTGGDIAGTVLTMGSLSTLAFGLVSFLRRR